MIDRKRKLLFGLYAKGMPAVIVGIFMAAHGDWRYVGAFCVGIGGYLLVTTWFEFKEWRADRAFERVGREIIANARAAKV